MLPDTLLPSPPRIVVVGATGAGKSTLAAALSRRLRIPHVELDGLHWEPGWTPAATEVFRTRIAAATAGEAWVVDGNYRVGRDLVWGRANVLVWIDLPLRTHLWRLLHRTFGRWWRQELLWGTNRERLRTNLFSRDSLFVWLLQTHGRRRREYAAVPHDPAYAHLRHVRLTSGRQAADWAAQAQTDVTAPL